MKAPPDPADDPDLVLALELGEPDDADLLVRATATIRALRRRVGDLRAHVAELHDVTARQMRLIRALSEPAGRARGEDLP